MPSPFTVYTLPASFSFMPSAAPDRVRLRGLVEVVLEDGRTPPCFRYSPDLRWRGVVTYVHLHAVFVHTYAVRSRDVGARNNRQERPRLRVISLHRS